MCLFWILSFGICHLSFAQSSEDLEFTLDLNANTIPLPKIFKPNIDLSGRGFSADKTWPRGLASPETLKTWQQDIGFSGIFRLQYNLWQIENAAGDKVMQDKLLENYEKIIKDISDAGGTVILDIFGTPLGLGRTSDIRSAPSNLPALKNIVKKRMRYLSCEKKYSIWYEVWSAPDLDDFFLGRKQDYFNLYRIVAEAALELTAESKIYIPVGGPGISWWFQNAEGNSIITPEKSLIYELVKFCYHYRLPLDFITWHGYSTDPKVEEEMTAYNKPTVALIRDWLAYFKFNKDTPLIIDEWNYDSGLNMLAERGGQSFIAASYILSRIRNMHEAGLDYQLYFCLEDFQDEKEGVVRNLGIFAIDSDKSILTGSPKAVYNVFRMLSSLGNAMYVQPKLNDDFVKVIATQKDDGLVILVNNYADPEAFKNYLSRNIAGLNARLRRSVLDIVNSDKMAKIIHHEIDPAGLRLNNKVQALLKKAQEVNDQAARFRVQFRVLRLILKNLKEDYIYQRYAVDSSCNLNCAFSPVEEKVVAQTKSYEETLSVSPYSTYMIVLKKKPKETESAPPSETSAPPAAEGKETGQVNPE